MLKMVVGGFYGDEGKGAAIDYLSVNDNPDIVIRTGGGPQAGHTTTGGCKVTQIPSGFHNPSALLLISRGTVINPDVVLEEIRKYGVSNRIYIDYGCTIIKPEHIEIEKEFVKRIGSVGAGTGPARVDRLKRIQGMLAKDVPSLRPYLADVSQIVNTALIDGKRILVEGVQGYALSLLNYEYYPYVTSQDTTACQLGADIGIGPKAIDEIYVIYKAYISRVGIGQLRTQWTEEETKKYGISEKGTVSGRDRRLGHFDKDLALKSFIANSGTHVVITCLDRLFPGNFGVTEFGKLSQEAQDFISDLHDHFKKGSPYFKSLALLSTGPDNNHMIDLR